LRKRVPVNLLRPLRHTLSIEFEDRSLPSIRA